MKYLITGAKGQLGLALQKELQKLNGEIYCYDVDTMDITNYEAVEEIFKEVKPDIVFNCAAHTNVDKCEEDLENAYQINALGVQNIAMLCEELKAKLIHISTDYVFSGEEEKPRIESDFVMPRTLYGKSKLYGEELAQRYNQKTFIIRTAWLYGEGNNFVRTMLKLAKTHDKLTVVGDQFGSPTYTKDLAKVMVALSNTNYYGLYHGTCQGNCSWYDFALKIFELMKIEIKVEKVTSEEFVRPAKRPKFSILDNLMLRLRGLDSFRNWEEALEDYLREDSSWQRENL